MTQNIAVIGAGVIGASTAWHLTELGHKVVLVDPYVEQTISRSGLLTGTNASLGVLMGHLFKRSKGRSWRLREKSMQIWPHWIEKLSTEENPLILQSPLIKVATSEDEAEFMSFLANQRSHLGVELLPRLPEKWLNKCFPDKRFGGILSKKDGRIDPLQLVKCLKAGLNKNQVEQIHQRVISLERHTNSIKSRWLIHLDNGETLRKNIVVICAAMGSQDLLNALGHNTEIEPVLGQAIEIQLKEPNDILSDWPAVVSCEGINLIPCAKDQIIMGATVESTKLPSKDCLNQMKLMNGSAPMWIKQASITAHWHGFRAKPVNQPAPILESLEPGLIVSTAHYRNGILLAPVSADWIAKEIKKNHIV